MYYYYPEIYKIYNGKDILESGVDQSVIQLIEIIQSLEKRIEKLERTIYDDDLK